ncbi:MAG TPA: nidogen-like domain-containing protein [Sandaracinaceae bacterium LLY-WYZ-13_1]|nr:nidogen-like domain-containing protein [Sandaracinaceae bacterium LLY-WYZ-13_1]
MSPHARTASLLTLGCLVAAALALLPSRPAAAQAPLLDTFGGPLGYGTNSLASNDDGSSEAIDLTPAFPGGLNFFGGPYTTAYVNNNGNITFNGPVYNYTPTPFPVADRPMIAPYWGDVDTRGGGYPDENAVTWELQPGVMAVTWHDVGYYSINDDRKMDFQMILRNALGCGMGDFDVEFRYQRCEWTTGDASGGSGGLGGTPAQAGFDAGNGTDFVEMPGSRTMAILDLCTTSNVGEPGIWRYTVRGGTVTCPDTGAPCDTGELGACGVGITQCVGRDEVCMPAGSSSPERCDGIDNDCDGMVDDGEDLCTAMEACIEGVCVPPCFEGGCAEGETCTDEGACIETACIDVTCGEGERCRGGTCVGACDGIVCPHGQQCFAGRCADLCEVLDCPDGEVCVDGACQPECPCYPCDEGETCGSDGACIPAGCDLTVCDPGFYCVEGECLDACDGAVCPEGQRCEAGACVDGPPPTPDAGVPPTVDAGPTGGPDAGGSTGGDGAASGIDGGVSREPPEPGCGCRAGGATPSPSWLAGLALLALAWRRRRR